MSNSYNVELAAFAAEKLAAVEALRAVYSEVFERVRFDEDSDGFAFYGMGVILDWLADDLRKAI